ncbi:Olfactory receptor 52H1 Olfactory receptor OR11-45 [Channa argus]|uniref:Olfactory receptor n=1 Tax=Channa argus TaxID=215402 RepID=A0A6G1PT61_CHAAH|nr:Olfactory receptor 52H1 Olfactory receptor OR11-45 [Channa argus]
MSTNVSSAALLTLESLGLSHANIYPAFLFGTLMYLLIMCCNLLVLFTIAVSSKLHKPMFILLLNLLIADMVEATAFFPHLVFSIVTQNRLISHPACVTQAFVFHVCGTGNLLILSAMSYDRYIAICCPLRYNTVMSPCNLIRIILSVWLVDFSLIVTLISLLAQFKLCRLNIVDLNCNNPSLMKLACEDTRVNNYYGLFTIIFVQGTSLILTLYTYAQILCTCLMNKQPVARLKAIQTCGTHLLVFLILQINIMVSLIAHRFESVSPSMRRALSVSVLVFPPFLDPIIYGLKITELRQSVIRVLKRTVCSPMV